MVGDVLIPLNRMKEQMDVSEDQIRVWQNDLESGRRFFWFSHTMHLLARQELDIRNCELVTCE